MRVLQYVCKCMANHKRFLGEIFSGLLALSNVADTPSVEKPRVEVKIQEFDKVEQKENGPEMDPNFRIEHPLEAEMRLQMHGLSEEKKDARIELMKHAMGIANELVASHRYTNEKSEKEYFAVCYDSEKWDKLVEVAEFASEKTKVPSQVILAMGFIESKMNPGAKNEETGAIGLMQITRATADDTVKIASKLYGREIKITSDEDLLDPELNMLLGAARLYVLNERLGQIGLAIAAYASSESALYEKLSKAFPEMDFGQDDWKEMKKQHDLKIKTHEDYMKLVKLSKTDHSKKTDHEAVLKSYKAFSDSVNAYKSAKELWSAKRAMIPEELKNSDATILTLFESIETDGFVPHSITYPPALDDLANRMRRHVENAKRQNNQRITSAHTEK